MSRTLEEAILHAEEVASDYEGMKEAYWLDSEKLAKCANEQRQTAEWLKELAERRKAPEVITCGECAKRNLVTCPFLEPPDDGYCFIARRKTRKENR